MIAHDLPGEGYIGDQGVARGGKIAAVGDVNIAWPQRKVADRRVGGLARLNRGDIEFEFAGGRWGLGDESQGKRTQGECCSSQRERVGRVCDERILTPSRVNAGGWPYFEYRAFDLRVGRPITNRPQVDNLPHDS